MLLLTIWEKTAEDLRTKPWLKNTSSSSILNLRRSVSLALCESSICFKRRLPENTSIITSIIQTSHQTYRDIKHFDSKQNPIVPAASIVFRAERIIMPLIWFSPKQTITSFPAAAVNLCVYSCFPEAFEATMSRTIVFCQERDSHTHTQFFADCSVGGLKIKFLHFPPSGWFRGVLGLFITWSTRLQTARLQHTCNL